MSSRKLKNSAKDWQRTIISWEKKTQRTDEIQNDSRGRDIAYWSRFTKDPPAIVPTSALWRLRRELLSAADYQLIFSSP